MNRTTAWLAASLALGIAGGTIRCFWAADAPSTEAGPKIVLLDPPERDFFSKRLDCRGIPIKAHQVVSDAALFEAYRRIDLLLTNLPGVRSNLVAAGAELHIIGVHQVTTDLPEFRKDKGVPLPEYHGLTRDQRTRGMGGLVSSCGEENLLRLPEDRYRGRDICVHEFAHGIFGSGISDSVRQKFYEQLKRSQDKGLWVGAYAASGNGGEFLSELTMWYVGTRGDLGMKGAKPGNGREGLKQYDPEAFALVDDFYSGRIEVAPVVPRRWRSRASQTNATPRAVQSKSGS